MTEGRVQCKLYAMFSADTHEQHLPNTGHINLKHFAILANPVAPNKQFNFLYCICLLSDCNYSNDCPRSMQLSSLYSPRKQSPTPLWQLTIFTPFYYLHVRYTATFPPSCSRQSAGKPVTRTTENCIINSVVFIFENGKISFCNKCKFFS